MIWASTTRRPEFSDHPGRRVVASRWEVLGSGEAESRDLPPTVSASVYREEDKTPEAVAAYQQITDMGGDCSGNTASDEETRACYARDGYQGQVDAYRDVHQWKDATAVAADAAKQLPKDHIVQLMYAQQLADMGQVDQGWHWPRLR